MLFSDMFNCPFLEGRGEGERRSISCIVFQFSSGSGDESFNRENRREY